MAKTPKSKTKSSKIDTAASDAVEVDAVSSDTPDEVVKPDDAGAAADNADEETRNDDVRGDDDALDEAFDASEDQDDPHIETVDEPVETYDTSTGNTTADVQLPQPVPGQKSNGFLPMVLGGLIAAALGYGVAVLFPSGDDTTADALVAQAERIDALENRVENLPVTDLSGLESRIDDLDEQTASRIGETSETLSGRIATFEERLADLEKQPNADGTLSETALAAYEQELEQLRADLNAQQESVMSAAAQAEADLAAARAEAETLEQEALAAANAAAARAALNRVATAVDTGAPYEDALADLDTGDLPAPLTEAAETGVATRAELTADFPAAARSALAVARSEGASDDAAGLGGFLRSQFDVRSTAPREGAGPDAVLSRAEAAVREGRIEDALAEIETLPEVARAEMTDWTARATQRAAVLNAIATLSETYN